MISYAQFAKNIVPFTLQYEGYYANVAGDKGGETYRGISRVFNPGWAGWATVDRLKPLRHNQPIPQLEDAVKQYYYDRYFTPKGFQYLDTKLALALFDFAVNGGYSASKFKAAAAAKYRATLSTGATITEADGKALSKIDSTALIDTAMQMRTAHYKKIIEDEPSQAKFADGWQSRMNNLTDVLGVVTRHPIRTALGIGIVAFATVFFCSSLNLLIDATIH